ncbi:MAG TPA: ATP-binding protein, partial [Myxococcota bacterium]|nr:ATP-binding protein [Myxococcota bacterium]
VWSGDYMPPLQTSGTGGVVIVSWIADSAKASGIEVGDRVIAVDGAPINEWFRKRGWEALRREVPVVFDVEKTSGALATIPLQPVSRMESGVLMLVPVLLASVAVGIAYLALGGLVWRLKPDRDESWAFLLFCAVMAMELFSAVHTYDALFGYERMLVNLPFLGATTFHLFTTFPVEPRWVTRYPGMRRAGYALAAFVALLTLVGPPLGAPTEVFPFLAYGCAMAGAAAGVTVLAREWLRSRRTPLAARVDVVFWGAALSFVPVLGLLSARLFFRASFPTSLALVWFVVLPASVAYGIARNQLFEIRGLARSSAAYGAATLAITGFFAFLITFADALFTRFNVNATSTAFSVTFLFFAILVFNPLRDRLQALVDRMFDRDRSGYRDAVREISEAMVSMLSLDEVVDRLLGAVTESMGSERSMVLLLDDEAQGLRPSAWRGEFDDDALQLELPVDHPVGKQLWMRRQELTRIDFDDAPDPETRDACRDVFDVLEVELLVPILFGVDLLGVIAVGRKFSGEALLADDKQLLRTLANQSAIAIENAKAFDEIAKLNETLEARVEERTRELKDTQAQLMQSEKMRSLGQLVAGVAHELNNPIGFVHANLQLLDGYVTKLIAAQENGAGDGGARAREAITKLLTRSREGTQRVKDIVQDLRTFSRMDQAELGDADLNEEIERTLALMEPRFKGGIRVERDFAALPRVRCLPGQLNQVFMNLVMNACDALEGKGSIAVRTRPTDGGVVLSFEDDGPGIPHEHRERIFEPFFTTKPVGKGTGLGLSISHGIIERHGGKMSVDCPQGGGTMFRIELPLIAKVAEV